MRRVIGFALSLWLTVAGTAFLSCSGDSNNADTREAIQDIRTREPSKYYQTRDAFSGELVNRNIYSDYSGKRVFFCCEKSKANFLKDPGQYMRRFEELGVALIDAPSAKQDSGSN